MTAAPPDPRFRDQPCGCRSVYVHDHGCTKFGTHHDSDRFRDQLAEASGEHRPNYEGEPWPWGDGAAYVGCVCGWLRDGETSFEQHRADALLPLISAAELRERILANPVKPIEAGLLDRLRELPQVHSAQSTWFHGWVEIRVVLSDWTWDAQEQPSALIDAFAREHVERFSVTCKYAPRELPR